MQLSRQIVNVLGELDELIPHIREPFDNLAR